MSKEGAVREQILDRSYKPLPAKRSRCPETGWEHAGAQCPGNQRQSHAGRSGKLSGLQEGLRDEQQLIRVQEEQEM